MNAKKAVRNFTNENLKDSKNKAKCGVYFSNKQSLKEAVANILRANSSNKTITTTRFGMCCKLQQGLVCVVNYNKVCYVL